MLQLAAIKKENLIRSSTNDNNFCLQNFPHIREKTVGFYFKASHSTREEKRRAGLRSHKMINTETIAHLAFCTVTLFSNNCHDQFATLHRQHSVP